MEHLLVPESVETKKKARNKPRISLTQAQANERNREKTLVKVRVDHKTEILVTPDREAEIKAEWKNIQREKKLSHNFHTMAKK